MLTNSLWLLEKTDEKEIISIAQSMSITPTLAEIIYRRGFTTRSRAAEFLFPDLTTLHSPFLMKNMNSAVERLRTAVSRKEKIGVFSDSDLDGMTALTVVHSMFSKMGITPFIRFPKNNENYGLTKDIIDEFIQSGATLVITADSGTRDTDEIAYCKSHGVDVIVTDHHEPDEKIPDAIILNPKQRDCPYPFKDLCGASVIFKFCQAFLYSYLPAFNVSLALVSYNNDAFDFRVTINGITTDEGRGVAAEKICSRLGAPRNDLTVIYWCDKQSSSVMEKALGGYTSVHFRDFANTAKPGGQFQKTPDREAVSRSINSSFSIDDMHSHILELFMIPSDKVYDFIATGLALSAIGSIADVMPMLNENRILVKHGIGFLNKTRHPGLLELKKNSIITSKTVAWEIAPLLNAPGRFGLTELTSKFFLSNDIVEIRSTIDEIRKLNEKRKELVNEIYSREMARIEKNGESEYRHFSCVMAPDIPEGLAGLIAVKISEKNLKPAIVISSGTADGIFKGSGRSSVSIDFFSKVEPLAEHFVRIGGHAQAFGFTIQKEKIAHVLTEIDAMLSGSLEHRMELILDAEIDIADIDFALAAELNMLAPFGKGNEEPVIISKDVVIAGFSRFGDGGKHGRFILEENPDIRVIGWRIADIMEEVFRSGKKIDMVYTIEEREFNNKKYLQMQLIDFTYH